jgi:hypothetical protein
MLLIFLQNSQKDAIYLKLVARLFALWTVPAKTGGFRRHHHEVVKIKAKEMVTEDASDRYSELLLAEMAL